MASGKRNYGTGSIRKRGKYYWIQYYHRGKAYRESSHSMVQGDAVNLLNQRLREVRSRGARGPLRPTSFSNLVALLRADYEQKNNKSLKRADQCIAHLAKAFQDDLATDITYERMSEYAKQRLEKGAARATVQQELAILRRSFTLAVQAGRLYARPAVPSIRFDNVRTGFFEDAEVENVIQHLPDYLRPLVRFLAISGWRKTEGMSLRWADVNWDEGTLRIPGARTKNGQPRVLPFEASPTISRILRSQWEATQSLQRESGQIVVHVFHRGGQPIRDFRHAWEAACKRAGFPGRLVHDLRRSAVRRFEQAGISRSVAMKITGHLTESVYRRYAITSAGDVAAALARVDSGHARRETDTKSAQSGPGSRAGRKPDTP